MDKSTYRIIDANFNRAREACRVIEDFCRFTLNSAPLTARAKQLRHELCATISNLDATKLLAARDTLNDVGVGAAVPGQMTRSSLYDTFTAAAKRLPEALRVITEALAATDSRTAGDVEQLRYRCYTLEKDVVLAYSTAERFSAVRLYVVISTDQPAEILTLTNRCIEGGADCLQLRAKDMPAASILAVASEMVGLCKPAKVLCIINDRVDIAVAADADGAHLGQNDLPINAAKKIAAVPLVLGKTTHNITQLEKAVAEAPTYVSLGPIFATPTKPALEPVGLDYVRKATDRLRDKGVAHAAIGGITEQNVTDVIHAGARAIAVCSAVTHAPDVIEACRNLKRKITDLVP
jgi:thiamine-phosphate pyrophosphorylase